MAQVLSRIPAQPANKNVIVGYDFADDAGVFRLRDDVALVQTVDFFTPITDDPAAYGRIAAVNSLNDVYAMGGKPLTALSIACYPQKEDLEILGDILRGGQQALNEEGVHVLGGHTIDDAEMKFGYAVTGIIHPNRVITNAGAKAGDVLLLTKPIGTGAISTGIKNGIASKTAIEAALAAMTQTARLASEAMQAAGANACTDVTGFGLIGHAYEMARASDVTLRIESANVPLLPDVLELIKAGMLTRGDKNNREYVGNELHFAADVAPEVQSALVDPQTAGGLLISVRPEDAAKVTGKVWARKIGEVVERGEFLIDVS